MMKSLISFLRVVLLDMECWCRVSTTRDRKTIESRIEKEGLSFLTITLPQFAADLERSLSDSWMSDDLCTSFRKDKDGFPRLFGGFLREIFDSNKCLRDDACVICIANLRQFCLMWAKIKIPCTPPRVEAALKRYISCEKEMESPPEISQDQRFEFSRIARLLFAEWFTRVDGDIYYGEILPQHGPGTTEDRTIGNAKYAVYKWTRRLEAVFPYREYLYPNDLAAYYDETSVHLFEPGAEPPVRVITVPKTQKTPRIIAIEPVHMQYVQQGILESMVRNLQDTKLERFLGWFDQEPNKLLARRGSYDGSYATLDLSDASDRVSYEHVRLLLASHPSLREGVDACRSQKARVGEEVIPLSKFASMGSALCFPIESCFFLTLVFLGIQNELRHSLTEREIYSFLGQVRVYGDDIIVPVNFTRSVIEALESFGLVVNRRKSFWGGSSAIYSDSNIGTFRESCGGDYFGGHDVSVVKIRELFPTKRTDAREIISTFSLRNQLYKSGFWKSTEYLDNLLEGLNIPTPTVAEDSPGLGRHSFVGLLSCDGYDEHLQLPLVKAMVVDAPLPVNEIDGYPALTKCLLSLERRGDGMPSHLADHLVRSGRPSSVGIKKRWVHSG